MCALVYRERPAAGEARGVLVLHHGRGSDEHNLLGMADVFDPGQQLHVVTPRAPLKLPGLDGFHWYVVPRVGHPDPASFHSGYEELAAFHDEVWERTGIGPERTVLGGFSMGTAMSFALGLGGDRPRPAGILGYSGFIPVVEGWEPDLASRAGMPVFLAHGTADPVIDIAFARMARRQLEAAGVEVDYHESDIAHQIGPRGAVAGRRWLASTLGLAE